MLSFDALNSICFPLIDCKRNISIYLKTKYRSNRNRSEHIALRNHQLKVRDILAIPNGIRQCVKFKKGNERKETYYYYIRRPGESKGFVCVVVRLDNKNHKKAYIKTIYTKFRIT